MYIGEFSFVYQAHLLRPLMIQKQEYNSLHRFERTVSYSPFAELDNIVAVKALKGNQN